MNKFKITIQKATGTGTEVMEINLNEQQVKWIEEGIKLGVHVPLYATTYAKAKFGDCILGNIINLFPVA